MSNLVALPAPEPQVNESAVEQLEYALAEVRAGRFTAVAVVATTPDTIYTSCSRTANNIVLHAIIGAMAELQRRLLVGEK